MDQNPRLTMEHLPPEILTIVFGYLDDGSRYLTRATCRWWRDLLRPPSYVGETCAALAASGDRRRLRWARNRGWTWTARAPHMASLHGKADCLRFLLDAGCAWRWSACLHAAAEGGHHECLAVIDRRSDAVKSVSVQASAAMAAASNGHLAALRWMWEKKYPLTSGTAVAAAAAGHLGCLRWMLRKRSASGTDRSALVGAAARGGHLECLQWMRDQAFPLEAHAAIEAVRGRSLECLAMLRDAGCEWDDSVWIHAARAGWMEALLYMRTLDQPWTEILCAAAAGYDRLDCLAALREGGCPWDDETPSAAAEGGWIDCLRYAHERGCPWSSETVRRAARAGKLECLAYACERGCPVDPSAARDAARRGELACLRYLVENGHIFGPLDCLRQAAFGCRRACAAYLISLSTRDGEELFTGNDLRLCQSIAEEMDGTAEMILLFREKRDALRDKWRRERGLRAISRDTVDAGAPDLDASTFR